MTTPHRIPLSAAILLIQPLLLAAQNPVTAPGPAFEVASIKPTEGQPLNSGFRRASDGTLNATNISLRQLIEYAYDIRDDQISGGPAWLETAHYEILAKPGEGGDAREAARLIKARTQTLLAERFHLVFHRETKQLPVLVLTVAKNGPKGLQPATAAAMDFVSNGHHLNSQRVSMEVFATQFLANQTRHSVMNKTGIDGEFDFTLDWAPDDAPAASADGGATAADFPAIFTALQEQLGLRLDPGKGPVETIVIDRAERPEGN